MHTIVLKGCAMTIALCWMIDLPMPEKAGCYRSSGFAESGQPAKCGFFSVRMVGFSHLVVCQGTRWRLANFNCSHVWGCVRVFGILAGGFRIKLGRTILGELL